MTKWLLLPVALLGLAMAGSGGAQVLDPNDAKLIQDWVNSKHIDYITTSPVATWEYMGATAGGVAMRAVLVQKHTLLGSAKVGLRLEHFAPTPGVDNLPTLSELASFDVDCGKTPRIKHTSTASFTDHGFEGEKKEQAVKEDWVPLSAFPLLDGAVKSACDMSKKD